MRRRRVNFALSLLCMAAALCADASAPASTGQSSPSASDPPAAPAEGQPALPAVAEPEPRFEVSGRIAGPDGLWDYASVDAVRRRLYIARAGGITAVDLETQRVIPGFFASPVAHEVLPTGDGRLLVTTGDGNKAVILDAASGRVQAEVATGKEPDAIAYDRSSGLAITFNRTSRDTTIFDVSAAKVVGGFRLPGAPEFAVSDSNGLVYVNIVDHHQIAVIDLVRKAITRTFPLPGCREPTGLALDAKSGLLIAACGNERADVLTTGGRAVATLPIGTGPDAVFEDAQRRLAFIPCGGDGTLVVLSLADPTKVSVLQRLKTQRGARTGAVDPDTGTVYLPVGKLIPPKAKQRWPSVASGTFRILIATPSQGGGIRTR